MLLRWGFMGPQGLYNRVFPEEKGRKKNFHGPRARDAAEMGLYGPTGSFTGYHNKGGAARSPHSWRS